MAGTYRRRFTGLGNELMMMAKAFIAAEELGLTLLRPSWGLSRRGYRHYFGTSRLDFLRAHAVASVLPNFWVTEQDYRATGELDFDKAIHVYAEKHRLRERAAFVLRTDGLWGEFYAIRKSAPFILKTLYGTRHTVTNMYHYEKLVADRELVVAVNIRLTDFAVPSPETDFRGLWNTRIPMPWYSAVCRSLRAALGDRVVFYLVTDGRPEEVRSFVEEFRPITHWNRCYSDVSNLLILTRADALVCSISSYSEWGAFLSRVPYFWYRPHLRVVDEWETIWGYLPPTNPLTTRDGSRPRGIPVGNDGRVPDWVIEHLDAQGSLNRATFDLVRSGGVPLPDSGRAGGIRASSTEETT
jgi:hypothetical protein